jgi:hypothetical protein
VSVWRASVQGIVQDLFNMSTRMNVSEEPVVWLGDHCAPLWPNDEGVIVFRLYEINGRHNQNWVPLTPGWDVFLTSIVLRRPDIRTIHVFYDDGKAQDVFHMAIMSMKYSGVDLRGYRGDFIAAKRFVRSRKSEQATSTEVKEALLVEDAT